MAKFGAVTENKPEVKEFVKATRERLKVEDLKTNPYENPELKTVTLKDKIFLFFNLEPIYFDTSIIGIYFIILWLALTIIFNWKVTFILYAGIIIIIVTKFMRGNLFHFLLFKKALKKRGVKNVKYLTAKKILERFKK